MCTESCHPILHIPECTETIFLSLPRKDLKSLRLTCITFDYVVLQQSNLFSRAYISCAGPDIYVLRELSASHLRECVTELVWDITAAPPVSLRQTLPDPLHRLALEEIIGTWRYHARKATDLEILLKVFVAFPKLNSVVFIELMASLVGPQPHNDRLYESPAMRQWLELGAGGLLDMRRPTETSLSSAVVIRAMNWAMEYIRRGAVDRNWIPQLEIGRYMYTPFRSPTLFLVAMSVLKNNLNPLLAEATPEMFALHGINDSSWMPKLNIVPSPRATALAGEPCHPLQSLQHLCLSLDNRNEGWEDGTNRLLYAIYTLHLRELELSLLRKEYPGAVIMPKYTQIQKLVLRNWALKSEKLKGVILDWCYDVGLESLHLFDCEISPGPERRQDVVQWFIQEHIGPYKAPTCALTPETEPLDIGPRELIFYNRNDLRQGGPARQLQLFFNQSIVWNRHN